MRITGGSKRGQRLVPWEEEGIRPMRDFVRTALFNILADLTCFAGPEASGWKPSPGAPQIACSSISQPRLVPSPVATSTSSDFSRRGR